MSKRFEITQDFEAFDQVNKISRSFSKGEKLYASYSEDKQSIVYQGFSIPVEYVKETVNTKAVLIYCGITIALIIAVVLIVKKIRKK
jgi:hypothetical protein